MSAMAFYNPSSDMDFMNDSMAMSMEYDHNDLQNEVEKILQGSDKFGFDYNILTNENSNQSFDLDTNNTNIDDWISSMQWNDVVKLNNNLLETSFEVENNNPNLLVNPQTGLPVNHYSPLKKPVPQISGSNSMLCNESEPTKVNTEPDCFTQNSHLTVRTENFTDSSLNISQNNFTSSQLVYSSINNNIPIQTVKPIINSPSQNSPVLVEHLQHGVHRPVISQQNNSTTKKPLSASVSSSKVKSTDTNGKVFPKPVYSYSCLIAMSLRNSRNGSLPVSEIYNFMTEHFPYFKTAPDGWKNSVRHNLSLNKCFAKVETPKMTGNNSKKGCLWALNPDKVEKMVDEIAKHRKKDLEAIRISMSKPEKLELIEAGKAGPVGPKHKEDQELGSPVTVPRARIVTITQALDTSKQEDYLLNSVNVLDNNLSLDASLPDLNFQNGIWDDLGSDMDVPLISNTGASPLTIQSVVSLGNAGLYQGHFTCAASPVVPTQNATVTQRSNINSVQSC